ncbi:MAG: PaaI family thioesterase [Alphaproteobacteria bacterium]|nr:PaaI family thioesterase [Alphaproteobacteria bacterium]
MAAITLEDLDRITREEVPFVGQMGVVYESVSDGFVTARLPFRDDLLRPGGTVTGPAMMGLGDIVMYAAVLSRIGPVKLAVTTSLTANFLRRPKPGDIIAEGKLLKCGQRLAYGEVTLFSESEDDPVCHITSTYSIPPRDQR